MAPDAVSKITTLVIVTIVVVLSIFSKFMDIDPTILGVTKNDTSIWHRLVYSFIHVGIIHAIVNSWVLLMIVFLTSPKLSLLFLSWIVSVIIPPCCLTSSATVGMSVMIYCLLGYLTLLVKRKLYFFLCCCLYIAIGFFFSSVNSFAHIYGYLMGILLALLIEPLWSKKRNQ